MKKRTALVLALIFCILTAFAGYQTGHSVGYDEGKIIGEAKVAATIAELSRSKEQQLRDEITSQLRPQITEEALIAARAEIDAEITAKLQAADAILEAFGVSSSDAAKAAAELFRMAPTPGIDMALMQEYGNNAFLERTDLTSDTSYRVRMTLPEEALVGGTQKIDATCFYTADLKAGETGKFVITATVNDNEDPYISVIEFTALDELHLIHGSANPQTYSGGDVSYRDGGMEIYFYTSVTDEFKRPSRCGIYGSDAEFSCTFIAC